VTKTRERTRHPGITKITTDRGVVSYRLIVDVGPSPTRKRNQECWTYRTLKEATDKRAQVLADRKAKTLVKRSDVTFDELCTRWLDSKHDVREVTRIGYADHLKIARSLLGRMKVQDIARSDVERVVRAVQDRGLSHRSVVVTLGRIKQVLSYGISEGVVAVNVASSVKRPRKQHSTARADTRAKDEPWSQEEYDRFRAVADLDEWAALWRLTLCGLRPSEVMGLSWDAVDLDRREVQIVQGRVLLDGHRRLSMTRSRQPPVGPFRWSRSCPAQWLCSVHSRSGRQRTSSSLEPTTWRQGWCWSMLKVSPSDPNGTQINIAGYAAKPGSEHPPALGPPCTRKQDEPGRGGDSGCRSSARPYTAGVHDHVFKAHRAGCPIGRHCTRCSSRRRRCVPIVSLYPFRTFRICQDMLLTRTFIVEPRGLEPLTPCLQSDGLRIATRR
jgi:integrase